MVTGFAAASSGVIVDQCGKFALIEPQFISVDAAACTATLELYQPIVTPARFEANDLSDLATT